MRCSAACSSTHHRVRRRRPRSVKQDSTTEGSWIGAYGTQGYDIIGNAASLPEPRHHRALRRVGLHLGREHGRPAGPPGCPRHPIAANWSVASRFTVDVDLTDGSETCHEALQGMVAANRPPPRLRTTRLSRSEYREVRVSAENQGILRCPSPAADGAIRGGWQAYQVSQTFHGAFPLVQRPSRSLRSRSVSMHCQKSSCR